MGLFTKDIKTMNDLFVHQLQDIYYTEQQLTKALPKMADKASDPQLKQGFSAASAGHNERLVGCLSFPDVVYCNVIRSRATHQ